ncbi:hypothetical protein, partial [Bordetella avium]
CGLRIADCGLRIADESIASTLKHGLVELESMSAHGYRIGAVFRGCPDLVLRPGHLKSGWSLVL